MALSSGAEPERGGVWRRIRRSVWGGMRGEGGVCYWGAQGSLAMPLLRGGEGRRGLPYQPSHRVHTHWGRRREDRQMHTG